MHYKSRMALSAAVQVRFPEATETRLDAVARRSGLAKSDLIRRAVDEFLDEVERTGSVSFPVRQDAVQTKAVPSETYPPHADQRFELNEQSAGKRRSNAHDKRK